MAKKTTDKLINELTTTHDINDFLEKNLKELQKLTLSQYLKNLIAQKQVTPAEIINRSGLNTAYAYHIFAGKKNPSRPKVLALAVAFALSNKETSYLLHYAGLPQLYVREPWDSVLLYALENHLSVIETNELLLSLSLSPLLE